MLNRPRLSLILDRPARSIYSLSGTLKLFYAHFSPPLPNTHTLYWWIL